MNGNDKGLFEGREKHGRLSPHPAFALAQRPLVYFTAC